MRIKVGSIYYGLLIVLVSVIALHSSQNYTVNVFDLDMSVNYFVLLFFTLLAFPLILYKRKRRKATIIFTLFTLIIVWALLQSLYTDYLFSYKYVIIPLTLSWVSILFPYMYSKIACFTNMDWKKIITSLSYLLTFFFVVYAVWFSFGFSFSYTGRLKGPLGGAAIIHLVMLPVLAVHLGNTILNKKKLLPFTASILTFIMIFLTGSRAAFVCLGLLLVLMFFGKASVKRILLVSVVTVLCSVVIANVVSLDRYKSFEDEARRINMETALELTLKNPKDFVLGNGYGTVWPWFLYENGENSGDTTRSNMISTSEGLVLYHPHSVIIGVLTELGVVALFLFISIVLVLVYEFFGALRRDAGLKKYLLLGLVSSLPSFFVDFYLFKNWYLTLIWWFFLFVAVSVPLESLKKEVAGKKMRTVGQYNSQKAI